MVAFQVPLISLNDMVIGEDDSPMGNQPSLGLGEDSLDELDDDESINLGDGEEEEIGEDVDVIRRRQKVNSVATISSLRMKPTSLSRLCIPLCRLVAMPMVAMPMVLPTAKLEQEFVHGYREGAAVF